MKKFLKFIVIFLGVLIVILFSITILATISKYRNNDTKIITNMELNPIIEDYYSINNFIIINNQLHLHLENINNNSHIIRSYDRDNGKLINEIRLK